ncbi:hypothetical protein BDN71DRAFT_524523 [Pleurotus eryngii]|uniref:Uncharacterized protein n=1 Tax=Pleurotus eryngii TaxID=5323 RepID=A0A9P5ZLW1_PLEER|nr:hypothetical protein BDN71DRAFT_524523 [Pleurotus eryngii]
MSRVHVNPGDRHRDVTWLLAIYFNWHSSYSSLRQYIAQSRHSMRFQVLTKKNLMSFADAGRTTIRGFCNMRPLFTYMFQLARIAKNADLAVSVEVGGSANSRSEAAAVSPAPDGKLRIIISRWLPEIVLRRGGPIRAGRCNTENTSKENRDESTAWIGVGEGVFRTVAVTENSQRNLFISMPEAEQCSGALR